ncbi:MAG: 5-deoxy-glucuronate isomerase [Bifidobacteriaceae bacterium]|jgi:5-deoxy-glucuronate isomerase|nr:5-deoxy-glucuronate isomerase [Bifidobacteriaceae bacterium]
MTSWYYPAGSTARGAWTDVIDRSIPGWLHTGLRIANLSPGDEVRMPARPAERIVLPLAGEGFTVTTEPANPSTAPSPAETFELAGRDGVWSGPTDFVYVGPHCAAGITGAGRIAVASAYATRPRKASQVAASSVAVELRGAGNASREVRNFGTPGNLDAQSIIACEVLTPAGNWSSYPPHKHDRELAGVETELEEIYYYEMRVAPGPVSPGRAAPLGYQRVSASDDRAIDVLAEVHHGDIVLVPFGWHGPTMTAPGYDMYYLNVMAGPGRERAWRITDHPDQAWIRQAWDSETVDPRLPFGARKP